MLQSFFTPFLTIFLAEVLDKSQLALIVLSTKHKQYRLLFLGSLLAFIVVDGLAIVFGSFVASLIPELIVKIVAGISFIIFGLLSFRQDTDEEKTKKHSSNAFINSFLIIFFAEWADKTQLAAGVFATQFDPLFVFLGVVSAMAILSFLAIILGSFLAKRINRTLLHKIAGSAFIAIGIYLLFVS